MTNLEKYVKIIVEVGINIQKGQKLLVRCPVKSADFAHLVMAQAYQAGADDVVIEWSDPEGSRISYLHAPDSNFESAAQWQKDRVEHFASEGYNLLTISAADPEIFRGVDLERLSKHNDVLASVYKPLKAKVSSYEIQWCYVCLPTPAWAKMVFPNACEDKALELLWDAIFAAVRIGDGCPVENWRGHIEDLQQRVGELNRFNFKHLRFKNGLGTDLEVHLPEGHIWRASGEPAGTGVVNAPNIPTEEIFTAPSKYGTKGVVYATKPLQWSGNVVEDFWLRFEGGKVVDYDAKTGKDVLAKLLSSYENADYLGEVALVPINSPLAQLGLTWYHTLFDENSACHLGLGNASVTCNKNKTTPEINQAGGSQEITIGSDCLEVIGVCGDGGEVVILKDGNFVPFA
ncbi:MAG: aminopeptidase [Defluviitaleaceae bacterium]|nr:aminopeptidase [Defluviitaleaceae bacterium]